MSDQNIFISYRRDDAAGHARLIRERLDVRFPGRVFMDVADIAVGADFVAEIERKVGDCVALIALIGKQWVTITDQSGRRRLDQPNDLVRLEVATALRRSITVIPVLVEHAAMPDGATLPEDLAELSRHNALEITEADFEHDVERLIERLNALFGPSPSPLDRKKFRFHRHLLIIGTAVLALFVMGGVLLFRSWYSSGNANNVLTTATTSPTVRPPTPTPAPPPGTVQFVNSIKNLDGKLAEHYADFWFYYPKTWELDPLDGVPGATNFVHVERSLPPDLTQENFAVGWYSSTGSEESDRASFHALVETQSAQFGRLFPEYRKVSEGPTKIGIYHAYEFRYQGLSRNTQKGDIKIWGRVVFVPPVDGSNHGVTLSMMATSLAPGVHSVSDVGESGQTPIILRSFRLGTTP
jgi:hypothetical protein